MNNSNNMNGQYQNMNNNGYPNMNNGGYPNMNNGQYPNMNAGYPNMNARYPNGGYPNGGYPNMNGPRPMGPGPRPNGPMGPRPMPNNMRPGPMGPGPRPNGPMPNNGPVPINNQNNPNKEKKSFFDKLKEKFSKNKNTTTDNSGNNMMNNFNNGPMNYPGNNQNNIQNNNPGNNQGKQVKEQKDNKDSSDKSKSFMERLTEKYPILKNKFVVIGVWLALVILIGGGVLIYFLSDQSDYFITDKNPTQSQVDRSTYHLNETLKLERNLSIKINNPETLEKNVNVSDDSDEQVSTMYYVFKIEIVDKTSKNMQHLEATLLDSEDKYVNCYFYIDKELNEVLPYDKVFTKGTSVNYLGCNGSGVNNFAKIAFQYNESLSTNGYKMWFVGP